MNRNEEMLQKMGYRVDLALCIDSAATFMVSKMGTVGIVDYLKSYCAEFLYSLLTTFRRAMMLPIVKFRVRFVIFRDPSANNPQAISSTEFYDFPQQEDELLESIQRFCVSTESNCPANGTNALEQAMCSAWSEQGTKRRFVILMLTDKAPEDMMGIEMLTDLWESMPINLKRLVLFAPDRSIWHTISSEWDNVLHVVQESECTSNKIHMDDIIRYTVAAI